MAYRAFSEVVALIRTKVIAEFGPDSLEVVAFDELVSRSQVLENSDLGQVTDTVAVDRFYRQWRKRQGGLE